MERLATSREHEDRRESRKAEVAASFVRPQSLEWASAVGNAAVQRLARQAAPDDEHEAEEAGPEAGAEVEVPPEAAALESAGIGHEALAGLGEVDQLGEDALPE